MSTLLVLVALAVFIAVAMFIFKTVLDKVFAAGISVSVVRPVPPARPITTCEQQVLDAIEANYWREAK